jgi:hypothetical protein
MKELTKKEIQRLIEHWFTIIEVEDMDTVEDQEILVKLIDLQGEMSDGIE